MLRNTLSRIGFVTVAVLASVVASAQTGGPAAPSLASLTPDFSTVTTAMLAIAGVVAGVIVTYKGIKWGYKALKGG
jgi:hypothetical protein